MREIALKYKNEQLQKKLMYQPSTILGVPLNYSLLSSSLCIASCETGLAFFLHPQKRTENLWERSTMSLIGGGTILTSMHRS